MFSQATFVGLNVFYGEDVLSLSHFQTYSFLQSEQVAEYMPGLSMSSTLSFVVFNKDFSFVVLRGANAMFSALKVLVND